MEHIRYLTDHYDASIQRIKDLNAPLNFIFITDQHHQFRHSTTEAVDSMHYILKECPNIQCVVSGGDIGNDYDPDPDAFRRTMAEMMEALYRLPVPVHCCIGNHDDRIGNCIDNGWDTRTGIFPGEMHALCMKYNPTPENYYYTDLDTDDGGYRFIFLNTSDKPFLADENGQHPLSGWRLEISNKQAEWFEKDALQTDRSILLFGHSPLSNAGIYGSEGKPDGIKPYDDLLNGPRIYYHAKRCRNVLAIIAGHVHFDNVRFEDDLPTITTTSAYRARWSTACSPRIMGTYLETAFDVMSIKGDTLYITRFGSGEDRRVPLIRKLDSIWNRTY